MAEETTQTPAESEKTAAKAAKKEKPPALEDKPFEEFMQQHYLPALQEAITKEGVPDVKLTFAKQKYSIIGFTSAEECWQVIGSCLMYISPKRIFKVKRVFPVMKVKNPVP